MNSKSNVGVIGNGNKELRKVTDRNREEKFESPVFSIFGATK